MKFLQQLLPPQVTLSTEGQADGQQLTVVSGLAQWASPSPVGSIPLTSAHILVGNGSNVAADVAASGDLTLANTGVFTIANGAVSLAKMADMATASLLGRSTAGSGAPEVLSASSARTLLGLSTSDAPTFVSATLTGLTASQAVFTDGSKSLVSNPVTGTGNVVMSASPTLTGTIGAAAMTLSSTLVVTGAARFNGNMGIGIAAGSSTGLNISGTTLSGVGQYGLVVAPTMSGATSEGAGAYYQLTTAASAFTMTNGYGIRVVSPDLGAGSAITNLYGLWIGDQTAGGTSNFAIYTGLGLVRFGDEVLTAASTASRAGLNIPSGTAPSSPVSGDLWYDGTNLKFRDGSTTRTLTWT